jgi:hypothetical protein
MKVAVNQQCHPATPRSVPWLLHPKDWACAAFAFAFHCSATVVDNISVQYVDQLQCHVDKVFVLSHTGVYCTLNKAFLPGSSGGAVVLADGSLLGILVKINCGSSYLEHVSLTGGDNNVEKCPVEYPTGTYDQPMKSVDNMDRTDWKCSKDFEFASLTSTGSSSVCILGMPAVVLIPSLLY